MVKQMEIEGVVAVSAILIGIFLATIAIIWQMHALGARIDAQGVRIDAQGGRISDVEREQARQEGVNSVLLRHHHTHTSEAAAD
jgi:hypothetical protein